MMSILLLMLLFTMTSKILVCSLANIIGQIMYGNTKYVIS